MRSLVHLATGPSDHVPGPHIFIPATLLRPIIAVAVLASHRALMLAHYSTAKPARLASGMPSTVSAEESARLFTDVSGYATRIAEMVKAETHFEAVPCPDIPDRFSDEESSDEDEQ